MPTAISEPHPFVPAEPGDSRSPCPALNALANHGHLPRDGRNISALQLIRALHDVYHVSLPFATLLTIGGTVWCGSGWKLDLEDLARHDRIEHNASLTHADATEGDPFAPVHVDKELLQNMLDTSEEDYLTFDDFVQTRLARDATLARPLNRIHLKIARGEVALAVEALGDAEGHVSKEFVRQWFGEQRLPGGWDGPQRVIGYQSTHASAKRVGTLEAQLMDAKKKA